MDGKEFTENEIWNRMLDSQMRACYFSTLSTRYTNIIKVSKLLQTITTSGAAISGTLATQTGEYWKYFTLIAATIAIINQVWNLNKSLINAEKNYEKWSNIHAEYEVLWAKLKHGHNLSTIQQKLEQMIKDDEKLNGKFSFKGSKKILIDCQKLINNSRDN